MTALELMLSAYLRILRGVLYALELVLNGFDRPDYEVA